MSFTERLIIEVQARPILWDKRCKQYKNRNQTHEEWEQISAILGMSKDAVTKRWRNLRDTFQKESKKVHMHSLGDPGISPNQLNYYTGKWAYFKNLIFLQDVIKHDVAIEKSQETDLKNETLPAVRSPRFPAAVQNQEFSASEHPDNEVIITTSSEAPSVLLSASSSEKDQLPTTESSHQQSDRKIPIRRPSVESSDSLEDENVFTIIGSDQRSDNPVKTPRSNEQQQYRKKRRTYEISQFQGHSKERKITAFKEKNNCVDDDEDMLFAKSLVPYLKTFQPVQKLRLKSQIQNLIADAMHAQTETTASSGRSVPQ